MIGFEIIKKEIPDYMLEYIAHVSYEILFRDHYVYIARTGPKILLETKITNIYSMVFEELRGGWEITCNNQLLYTGNYTSFKLFDDTLGTKLLGIKPVKVNLEYFDLFCLLLEYLPSFEMIECENETINLFFKGRETLHIGTKNFSSPYNFISPKKFNSEFRSLIQFLLF